MKKYLVSLLLLCACCVNAQKPLNVGDKLPGWKFTPLVNASAPVQLKQYFGKPFMICFWVSSCGGCLHMLTQVHQWQKDFGNDFKFLLVSDDTEPSKPIALLNRRKDLKDLGIPIMNRDTGFFKFFPHNGDPHLVLVGSDGFIKAITGAQYVDEEVIKSMVAGKNIRLPVQKPSLTYEQESSLYADGFLNAEILVANSVLTGYIDNLSSGFKAKVLAGNRLRLSVDNVSIPDLYAMAYSNRLPLSPGDPLKTLVVNAKDKKRFGIGINDPLETKHKYCYELIVPRGANKTNAFALDYMKTDLDRYFNTSATIEKRMVTCYQLVPKNAQKTTLKDKYDQYVQPWPGKINLHNQSLGAIIGQLDLLCDAILIMDNNTVDRYTLTLKDKYNSLEELKADLKLAGFELTPVQKEIEFLVVTEK